MIVKVENKFFLFTPIILLLPFIKNGIDKLFRYNSVYSKKIEQNKGKNVTVSGIMNLALIPFAIAHVLTVFFGNIYIYIGIAIAEFLLLCINSIYTKVTIGKVL